MRRLIREIWPVAPFLLLPLLLSMAQAQQWGPLLLGTASSGGVSGCVWSATQINSHLTGGGTTIVTQTGSNVWAPVYGNTGKTSGKWYWEAALTASPNFTASAVGIGNTSTVTTDGHFVGFDLNSVGVLWGSSNIQFFWDYTDVAAEQYDVTPSGYAKTDRLGMALDLANGYFWWRDVTAAPTLWYGSSSTPGDPTMGASGGGFNINFSSPNTGITVLSAPVVAGAAGYGNGDVIAGYFNSSSWVGTAPSGYSQCS